MTETAETEVRAGLPIIGFADQAAFQAWIDAQPADAPGLWIRFARKGSETVSLSKAEAIDVALCHGWIDGQLDRYDDAHWLIRFTPRKARSKWSELNRRRATELIDQGRMQPGGAACIAAAQADGRWDVAYAPASTATVPLDLKAALDADPAAAAFFATLTGANRYAILHRIATAAKPETRASRITKFVAMLARGETIHG